MAETQAREGLFVSSARLFQREVFVCSVAVLIGLVCGLVYGFTRPTTYHAEARLLVGTFDAPAEAIPGYVLAAQTVAGEYARLANSTAVLDPLSQQLGVSAQELGSIVTVTAIPKSAIIRVVGTSTSAEKARVAAESMATTMQQTISGLNVPGSSDSLLAAHEAAAKELAAANTALTAAQNAYNSAVASSGSGSAAANAAQQNVANAQIAQSTAQLREQGLAEQYRSAQLQASTSGQIRVLGSAVVTQESKATTIVTTAALGLIVGLVLGLVVARRNERVRARHAARQAHPTDHGPARAEPADHHGAQGEVVGSGSVGTGP